MQKGSVLGPKHNQPNHWLQTHDGHCAHSCSSTNGQRFKSVSAKSFQHQKHCHVDARRINRPARRSWLRYRSQSFVTAASNGTQKPSTADWSSSISHATSKLLWHFAPRLAKLLQQASGDQPSLSALLAAEFISMANNWKQERVSLLPPIRQAGLGAFIDGWTLTQENFYLKQSTVPADNRPSQIEDSAATAAGTTNASAKMASVMSSVLVDPITLIIAPELSANCDETSLSSWLSQRGLLAATSLQPPPRDNKAMQPLKAGEQHAFVMQQILELILAPGTQRIIPAFPPTPTAGWLAITALRIVAVSKALGICTENRSGQEDDWNSSTNNNRRSISSYHQELDSDGLVCDQESTASQVTADAFLAEGVGAPLPYYQKLTDTGLAHLQSCVYLPIKDALEHHLEPSLLLCGWLYQLVVACMVLYESNASRSSPDKLIICQAVAADLYTGIRVLQDVKLPLSDHMALYLLTQQLAIGTELHELGMEQDDLFELAVQIEKLAAVISASQPCLVVLFDAYHRLGEYHLHVTQDLSAARDALQKALIAFKQREARTCDGFQEWSDDLSICSLHSYWRDVSDTALQETIAKGPHRIQLASLPGAVYLYRDKLRCILSLLLIERSAKQDGKGSISSNWSAYNAENSLPAVTELLTEAARQQLANNAASNPGCSKTSAGYEIGAVDNEHLTDMYLHTTVAIQHAIASWQSSMGIHEHQTIVTVAKDTHGNQASKKHSRHTLPQQTLQLKLVDVMSAPQPGLELCRLSNSFTTRYMQLVQEQRQEFLQHVNHLVNEVKFILTTSGILSCQQDDSTTPACAETIQEKHQGAPDVLLHSPISHPEMGLLQDGSIVIRLISPLCMQLLTRWQHRPTGISALPGTDLHSVLLVTQEVQAAVHGNDHRSDWQLLTPELPAAANSPHLAPTTSTGRGVQQELLRCTQSTEHRYECQTSDMLTPQLFGSRNDTDLWQVCQQLRLIQSTDQTWRTLAIRRGRDLLNSCGTKRGLWASLLEMQLINNASGIIFQQANTGKPMLFLSYLLLLQQAAAAGDVQQVLGCFRSMISAASSLLSAHKRCGSSSRASSQTSTQLQHSAQQLLVDDVIAACNSLLHCVGTLRAARRPVDDSSSIDKDCPILHQCNGCMYQALQLGCALPRDHGVRLQAAVLCSCAEYDHKLVVKVLKEAGSAQTYVHPMALSQCLEHYLATRHVHEVVSVVEALAGTSSSQSTSSAAQDVNSNDVHAIKVLIGSLTSLVRLVMNSGDNHLVDRVVHAIMSLPAIHSPGAELQRATATINKRSVRFQLLDQVCAAALHFDMCDWLTTSLLSMLKDRNYDGGLGITVAVVEPVHVDSPHVHAGCQQQGSQPDSHKCLASRLAAVLVAGQLTANKSDTLLELQWSVMETLRSTTDGCLTLPAKKFVDHLIQLLIAKDDEDTARLILQVVDQAASTGFLSQAALSCVLCHAIQSSRPTMTAALAELLPLIPTPLWTASLEDSFITLSVSSNHTIVLQLLSWLLEEPCRHLRSSYIPSEQVCKVLLLASYSYVAETSAHSNGHRRQSKPQLAQGTLYVAPQLLMYINSAPAKAQSRVFTSAVTTAAELRGGASTIAGQLAGGLVMFSDQKAAQPQQFNSDHSIIGSSGSTSGYSHHLFVAMAALLNLSTLRSNHRQQHIPQPVTYIKRHRWSQLQAKAIQAKDSLTDKQQYAAACAQLLQLLADIRPGVGIALPPLLPRNAPVVQSKQPFKRFKRPTRWQNGFQPESSNSNAQGQLLCTVYERSFAWCSHDLLAAASLSTLLSVCQAYLAEHKLELAVSVATAAPSDTSVPLMTFLLNCQEVTNARVLPTTVLVEMVQQACLLRSPALLQQALQLVSIRGRLLALIKSIRRQTYASMTLLLLRQPTTSVALALTKAWVEHQHTGHGKAFAPTSGTATQPAGNVQQQAHAQWPHHNDAELTDNTSVRRLGSSVWYNIAQSCLRHVNASNTKESCLIGVELAMLCSDQCQPQYATLTRCAVAAAVMETELPVIYAVDALSAVEESIAMSEVALQPGLVLDAIVTMLNRVMDARTQELQPIVKHIAAISSWVLPVLIKLPVKQRQALSDSAHRALIVLLCEHGPTDALHAWHLWQSTREGLKISRDARSRLLVAACDQAAWDVAYGLSTDLLQNEWPLLMKDSSKPSPSARWHQLILAEKLAHISVMSACQGRVRDCFQVLKYMLGTGSQEQNLEHLYSMPKSLWKAIAEGSTHQDCCLNAAEKAAVSKALEVLLDPCSHDHAAEISAKSVQGQIPTISSLNQRTVHSVFAQLTDMHCTAN